MRISFIMLSIAVASCAMAVPSFSVHNVFGSHMVVQRDRPVRISGTAPAGTEIMCYWFPEKENIVKADTNGNWVVEFPARHSGGGMMTFGYKPWSGPQIILEDVVVGEVWLATGQSNMNFPVRALKESKELIASLEKENDIRFINVPHCSSEPGPWNDFAGRPTWTKLSDSKSIREASAVGVYFARALKRELLARNDRTPIGIVMSNWGGTTIERWEVATGDLWNAMLSPATEMNVRGAIWYQGCSNTPLPDSYRPKQHKLIDDWRREWRDPNFVFIITELASYFKDRANNPLPADYYMGFGPDQAWDTIGYSPFRQMQTEFLDREGVGCSLTFDVGEQSNLHPTNKVTVGERLCREALRLAYGDKTILPAPRFDSMHRDGESLVVSFKDVGEGLEAVGGAFAPHLWAIKGETEDWKWADAELLSDNTIRLTAEGISKPTGAQYAYMAYHANPNFHRKGDGMPVFSFRRMLPTAVTEEIKLFDGTDTSRWYAFIDAVGKTNAVDGIVRDGELVFDSPKKFSLTTINEFSDYRLELEYRLGKGEGEAGIVVHSSGNKGMIGNFAMAGDYISLVPGSAGTLEMLCGEGGFARTDMTLTHENVARTSSPDKTSGEWNHLTVTCRGNEIVVSVNGVITARATGVSPSFGPIQLLNQGYAIQFRSVRLYAK